MSVGIVQTFTTDVAPTGVEGVREDADDSKTATVAARYNINGQPISSPQKGVNVLRMSDGTTRKVFVK